MKNVPLTFEFKAIDPEQIRKAFKDVNKAMQALRLVVEPQKNFTVLAGRYDPGCIDEENPLGENIKYIDEFKTLPEAWEVAQRYYSDPGAHFTFIEHRGERTTIKK